LGVLFTVNLLKHSIYIIIKIFFQINLNAKSIEM
jgi:hypothetical protein